MSLSAKGGTLVADSTSCSACEAVLSLPYLCESCGELFRDPVGGLNAYQRFGIEPSFALDLEALEARHLQLSRRLHPDRLIGKDPRQQGRALTLSSSLNEAYALLRDERSRAEHLVVIGGGKTADQDKRTPPMFLMEQLELREELEQAQESDDQAALGAARERTQTEQAAARDSVAKLLGDPTWPTDKLRDALRLQLNVWKYWITLGKELS
ncbi:MAG: Fe-S protein assembly co-chaperone HscB [Planctomycetes bacterium]|nr:Fe-S protein assembly co-chaperone HscB [Planctomycetota bacterium]